VETDAEHQEDHAEFGHLVNSGRVAPESRGQRPQGDAGDQISDDRWQADSAGEQAADKRIAQSDSDVDEKRQIRHGLRQNTPDARRHRQLDRPGFRLMWCQPSGTETSVLTNKLQTTVSAVSLALLAICWQAPARGNGCPAASEVCEQSTDLNGFMKQVLEKRDENWKKLQQYILEERERVEVHGPAGLPIWGQQREYQWFIREGYFIRSPLKADGVQVPEADRRRYEDNYLRRIKARDEKEKAKAKETGTKPAEGGSSSITISNEGLEVLLQQSRDPQFVDSAYFMHFKFDQGRYALMGKEKIEGIDVLRIEYYPTKLFNDDDEKKRAEKKPDTKQAKKEQQFDATVDKLMNKNSKVTIWVEPKTHQIVQYVFDNVKMDFLPAGWLIKMEELKASMSMSQPFKGVWLPKNVQMYFSAMFAVGMVDVKFNLDYYDYQEATTAARIKGRGGF
jgi:hypothetical protein